MKPVREWVTKNREYVLAVLMILYFVIILYSFSTSNGERRTVDIDGDGVMEKVEEIHDHDETVRLVTEPDGTKYLTMYYKGNETIKWKYVPDPTNKDKFFIYVWDKERGEWRLDQDRDGIPDEKEPSNTTSGNPGQLPTTFIRWECARAVDLHTLFTRPGTTSK